jgi:LPXTG-site transpeptidase (sortase) family protein
VDEGFSFNPYPDLARPRAATRPALVRALELSFLAVGLVLLGTWATTTLEAHVFQISHAEILPVTADVALEPGTVIGRIELPEIGVSSLIVEGVGDRELDLAVGHIPGTPLPGQAGNVGLAGHRDTWFRGLRHAEVGQRVVVTSPLGQHEYTIVSTRVVEPDAVDVLAGGPEETVLTLVTCHPFTFLGRAPRRFVVRAEPVAGSFAATAG